MQVEISGVRKSSILADCASSIVGAGDAGWAAEVIGVDGFVTDCGTGDFRIGEPRSVGAAADVWYSARCWISGSCVSQTGTGIFARPSACGGGELVKILKKFQ